MQLITETVGAGATRERRVLSRDDALNAADFDKTGRLFLVPNITKENLATLRAGGRVQDKKIDVWFQFQIKSTAGVMEWRDGVVTVTAQDFAEAQERVFFGDRPLDNPGYSDVRLAGNVGLNDLNRHDVFKVEQRLKYLGYSAFGVNGGRAQQLAGGTQIGTLREFVVDGTFGTDEQSALRAFYGATHYRRCRSDIATNATSGLNGFQTTVQNNAAKEVLFNGDADSNLAWLSAYNAPHWLNNSLAFGIRYGGAKAAFQDGTRRTQ